MQELPDLQRAAARAAVTIDLARLDEILMLRKVLDDWETIGNPGVSTLEQAPEYLRDVIRAKISDELASRYGQNSAYWTTFLSERVYNEFSADPVARPVNLTLTPSSGDQDEEPHPDTADQSRSSQRSDEPGPEHELWPRFVHLSRVISALVNSGMSLMDLERALKDNPEARILAPRLGTIRMNRYTEVRAAGRRPQWVVSPARLTPATEALTAIMTARGAELSDDDTQQSPPSISALSREGTPEWLTFERARELIDLLLSSGIDSTAQLRERLLEVNTAEFYGAALGKGRLSMIRNRNYLSGGNYIMSPSHLPALIDGLEKVLDVLTAPTPAEPEPEPEPVQVQEPAAPEPEPAPAPAPAEEPKAEKKRVRVPTTTKERHAHILNKFRGNPSAKVSLRELAKEFGITVGSASEIVNDLHELHHVGNGHYRMKPEYRADYAAA